MNVESEKSISNVLSEVKSPPPVKPVPAVRFLDCNVSMLDSSVVNLVENPPLASVNEPLTVVAVKVLIKLAFEPNEPLTVDLKVESSKSMANVLSEVKSPPPVKPVPAVRFRDCSVSTFPSSVVILVENEALSVTKLVNLVDILALGATKEPLMSVAI